METRKLLIVGSGRSGTLYTSKVLSKIGYPIGHERVAACGACSMYFVSVAGGWEVWAPTRKDSVLAEKVPYRFETIWHQVRHPLKTIDSLAKSFNRSVRVWTAERFGFSLPGKAGNLVCPLPDKIRWATRYWIEANRACRAVASWTYRIEDWEQNWGSILGRLEIPLCSLPKVSTTTHRDLRFAFKSKPVYTHLKATMYDTSYAMIRMLDGLLAEELQAEATTCGYTI